MSSKHLAKGSTKPPNVEGKLRLYSMEFCPYALRVRLVLLVKQLPHDIVNVHLKNKPEWLFELHPEGKVPALDTGSQIVIESLDICDYLDEKYPEPALYPKDENKRLQDKILIKEFGELASCFSNASNHLDNKSFSEYLEILTPHVQKYENELRERGGVFFGGDKPSMIDYMVWPWGQRAPILKLIYNQELPSEKEYPNLYQWCKAMRNLKPVQDTFTEAERLYKLNRQYVAGPQAVDFDNI